MLEAEYLMQLRQPSLYTFDALNVLIMEKIDFKDIDNSYIVIPRRQDQSNFEIPRLVSCTCSKVVSV